MTTTVADIVQILETVAPLHLAEPWDNPGLQVGHLEWPVKKIMVALDPTREVLTHAAEASVDLLITHHPLLFSPIRSIDLATPLGDMIGIAIRNTMAVYAAHTNLDSVAEGLNDILVARLGMNNISILAPHVETTVPPGGAMNGLGRIGDLPRQTELKALCSLLKQTLRLESVRMIGSPQLPVSRVAVCTGSGTSLLNRYFSSDAHVFITGDIRYHDAREAEGRGAALIDIGHFGSEHIVVKALCDRLAKALADRHPVVTVLPCEVEKDPFIVV